MQVVVFEQCPAVGGVWVFDDQVDSDVLGTDRSRTRVHTSMYRQLRTNLPREVGVLQQYSVRSTAAVRRQYAICSTAAVQCLLLS